MQGWRPGLSRRTIPGTTVRAGDRTVTPWSSSLVLRVGGNAVFVWNRPIGVDVAQGGTVRRVRIVDQGRLAWIGLGGVLALLMLLLAAASPRKERDE